MLGLGIQDNYQANTCIKVFPVQKLFIYFFLGLTDQPTFTKKKKVIRKKNFYTVLPLVIPCHFLRFGKQSETILKS